MTIFGATFASKVAVVGTTGAHIRYIPGTLAASMVSDGIAAARSAGGKVREVALTRTADTHAQRIGPSDGRAVGVKFFRTVRLDASASRIFEHHPRCTYDY
jgi:hypothetical protein